MKTYVFAEFQESREAVFGDIVGKSVCQSARISETSILTGSQVHPVNWLFSQDIH
ncbi:hypothetical protein DMR_24070 [Solidesulfovibrio magneticus RS-1]|uniref:Uncharacterized protein n=1 Tax=Solidesulfovibrio magneticus (strain ATCC 700980 / DSM 13731 / RS-1) TaxID=573370 RepID=C4XTA1_SOLM1|nr:hypothetical protein DMR_24070 [Solidesulfovibrio magneticus RS-1]